MYNIHHCNVYTIYCTVYNIHHCNVYNEYCTVYNIHHCNVYTVYCTVYNIILSRHKEKVKISCRITSLRSQVFILHPRVRKTCICLVATCISGFKIYFLINISFQKEELSLKIGFLQLYRFNIQLAFTFEPKTSEWTV